MYSKGSWKVKGLAGGQGQGRVILPRDEWVPHAHVGVVVSMQVPLAKGGVAVPLPLGFPLPLS